MKDILGREIKVGDLIAYGDSDYADVHVGVVAGFTSINVKFYPALLYKSPGTCYYDSSFTAGRNFRKPRTVAIINDDNIKLVDESKLKDEDE